MIKVNVIKMNGEIRAVVATGHAEKGAKAVEICSGVSTLMYTLALMLQEINRVGVRVTDNNEGMSVDIIRGHLKREAKIVTATILRGLRGIADLYPHSLRIYITDAAAEKYTGE